MDADAPCTIKPLKGYPIRFVVEREKLARINAMPTVPYRNLFFAAAVLGWLLNLALHLLSLIENHHTLLKAVASIPLIVSTAMLIPILGS
jgi:hypothetical protein